MLHILDETQLARDQELSEVLGIPLGEVEKLEIASPKSIMIYAGSGAVETKEKMEKLYTDLPDLDFPAYVKTLMYTSVYRRHRNLMSLIRHTKGGKKCLDFGSGVGTHSIALAQNDNEIHLLDIEGRLYDFAKERLKGRGVPFMAFSHEDNLPDDCYDVIICSDVLEHTYDPIAELHRVIRSIKSGGLLHILVSTMVKPSSGHFEQSILKWRREGTQVLRGSFAQVSDSIWRAK